MAPICQLRVSACSTTLKDDLVRVSQENQIKSQRIDQLQQSVEAMRRNLEMITEVLARNPSVRDVELALQRKKRTSSPKEVLLHP